MKRPLVSPTRLLPAVACVALALGLPFVLPPGSPATGVVTTAVPSVGGGTALARAKPTPTPTPPQGPPADSAVAFQEDAGHTGALAGDALVPGLVQRWSLTFEGQIGYPLIVPGHLYTCGGGGVGSTSLTTGSTEWGHSFPFPTTLPDIRDLWCGLAYDGGRLFALDGLGTLLAFDSLGSQAWSVQLPGNVAFSAAPTASGGVVYVTGTGGTPEVYAVSEASGQLLWTSSIVDGFQSSPAVGASGVYVGYLCQQVYGLTTTGTTAWHDSGGCATGGGRSAVLAGGRLYARDPAGNLVLDAQTGARLGTFAAGPPPAFDGSAGYFVHDGVLDARDAATLSALWTFTGDGRLVTAPIVVNGYVYVGSALGNLFAVSTSTGQSAWWSNVAGCCTQPDGPGAPIGPIRGLAAGQGFLAVPGDRSLALYSGGGPLSGPPPSPSPSPSPTPSPSPSPPPTAPGGVVLGPPAFFPTGSARPAAAALGNFSRATLNLALADPANASIDVLQGFAPGEFSSAQRLPAGSQPSGVTGGRFRTSGLLDDAAVANAGSNTVTVYLNSDGNPGGLTPGRSYPAGSGPADVAACDLDRDGKLDLAVADRDGGAVSVLPGNGDGTFGTASQFVAGQTPVREVCTDVDGDGNPDVVVANRDADALSFLKGSGTGTLATPIAASLHAGARPQGLAAFDFNGDGVRDVSVAEPGSGQVGVLLGLGGGRFGQEITYATGASPWALTVLPGYSPFRLAVADRGDNDVTVLQGLQEGSFERFGRFPAGPGPVFVASAGLGLVTADGGDGTAAALAELPASAGYAPPVLTTGAGPIRLAVADMDGDGHPDVVAANRYIGSVTILTGTGSARLGASHDYTAGPGEIDGLAVGDLDGDGRPDVAVTDELDNTAIVMLNTGTGLGPPKRAATGVHPLGVAIGDFNSDGRRDLAVADFGFTNISNNQHTDSNVAILLGAGDGTFQAPRLVPAGDGPTDLALADLNGDGNLDVVNETDADFGVWTELGNGDGTFRAPVNSMGLGNLLDLTLGDIDGDGRVDAVTSGTSLAEWLPGRGDGTFGDSLEIDRTQLTDSAEPGVAVGDLNGDGVLDVVAADFNANGASVFVGQGGGAFYARVRFPLGLGPDTVAISDLTGDGFPEVIVADGPAGGLSLMPNLSGQASTSAALRGTVVTQPTCPSLRAGQPCAPAPLAGATVEVRSGGVPVATATTDTSGHFDLRLPHGQYQVRVANPSLPRLVTESTVALSSDTVLNLSVGSGIR